MTELVYRRLLLSVLPLSVEEFLNLWTKFLHAAGCRWVAAGWGSRGLG